MSSIIYIRSNKKIIVENGQLIIEDIDGHVYSFDAHGEEPRPSMYGLRMSVAGKHWSDHNPDTPIEKHTSVQDVVIGNGVVAWYTQEFLPNGIDYKVSKNSKVYVGSFETGTQRCVYKGGCYGDLCFEGNKLLYINVGNKIGVINLENDVYTELFKHSAIKKNGINLKITTDRIFFTHWTRNEDYLMWYDKNTKEIINPHVDSWRYFVLDESRVIYRSLYHTWVLNVETLKKKRFFADNTIREILEMVCGFLDIPSKYYVKNFRVELSKLKDNTLSFVCKSYYSSDSPKHNYETSVQESLNMQIPYNFEVTVTCDIYGANLHLCADREIVRSEDDTTKGRWKWSAIDEINT